MTSEMHKPHRGLEAALADARRAAAVTGPAVRVVNAADDPAAPSRCGCLGCTRAWAARADVPPADRRDEVEHLAAHQGWLG